MTNRKPNRYEDCFQNTRITRIETQQENIQEQIQKLEEVDKGLQKTIIKLDKTVTKFCTLLETLIKNQNNVNPWWYVIITGVAVYLITHLIDLI